MSWSRRYRRPIHLTMTTTVVFFKPRPHLPPPHESHGSEWIPIGTYAGPFHPDQHPNEAIDRRVITCSADLVAHWEQFHHEIRPLLVFPSVDSAPLRCLLYDFASSDFHRRVEAFGASVGGHLVRVCLKWMPRHHNDNQKELLRKIKKIDNWHIIGMSHEKIEMKMWAVMLHDVEVYLAIRDRYRLQLERHCNIWDKVYVAARRKTVVSLNWLLAPPISAADEANSAPNSAPHSPLPSSSSSSFQSSETSSGSSSGSWPVLKLCG
ncbi:hypothetical protein B0H17DRAFT_126610 [Mycena rosella]|uniref:Uncharacterized protein n=1 Tax=Mycena rosella TaxID=1033263 RepID=A0AAD7D2U8_MYCRO|nr:hypothetical protein B0H17DRAFT_126610 [Mycena rosella]